MHFTPPFYRSDTAQIQSLLVQMGAHGMASIICADDDRTPYSSFLPVDVEIDMTGETIGCATFHLANNNHQMAVLQAEAITLMEWRSANHYISPAWFVTRNRAPTNVHVAIQCLGTPQRITDAAEKQHLIAKQVMHREKNSPDAWDMEQLDSEGSTRRLNAISVYTMALESGKASVRMLQDEPIENVQAVLSRLAPDQAWLANMIRYANKERL